MKNNKYNLLKLEVNNNMFKSKNFECSTASIGNSREIVSDKIEDLKAEQNFI
jgi:hypothetical protein